MKLFDQSRVHGALSESPFASLSDSIINAAVDSLDIHRHGDRDKWLNSIGALPKINIDKVDLTSDHVTVKNNTGLSKLDCHQLETGLRNLHPWRKGPFDIFGLRIDAEWRSDLKWQRIVNKISPLKDRRVLDVGCGNGYYLFRMQGAGARLCMGIDPTQLFLAQFAAINRYVDSDCTFILPFKSEELFALSNQKDSVEFDTVFSLGVYYHRRDPQSHLQELYGFVRPGGELVLETLVIRGDKEEVLHPTERYAQMRNVWSVPSAAMLLRLLNDAGFTDTRLIDLTTTTPIEQRSTSWMTSDSLGGFLMPGNPELTIEGYPAPLRATFIANRPD